MSEATEFVRLIKPNLKILVFKVLLSVHLIRKVDSSTSFGVLSKFCDTWILLLWLFTAIIYLKMAQFILARRHWMLPCDKLML